MERCKRGRCKMERYKQGRCKKNRMGPGRLSRKGRSNSGHSSCSSGHNCCNLCCNLSIDRILINFFKERN